MENPILDGLRRSTYPLQVIFSIPIMVAGIWLGQSCANFGTHLGFILLALYMFVFGLFGCLGMSFKSVGPLFAYFFSMLCLLLGMLGFIIFLFVITRHSSSSGPEHPQGPAYREYSLWFRRRLSGFYQWDQIVNCLTPSNWCAPLDDTYNSAQQLFNAKLTPLQSGCCMPPSKCGYTFVSPTKWTSSSSSSSSNNQTNTDCANWNNDPRKLCYFCDSCKAGLLTTITKRLNTANLILLITFLLSFIVYIFHCIFFCTHHKEYN
ncbi:hypothetical protein DM860_005927 [Cuscuta australis]|uniref:Tetraspanin n=1 Tax=Cuscuta australis TaxID=267555 RepID=A0A328DWN4_9ASTE|nr:hypothetical protein DM860_005927 [Cuscuta australis]